MEIIFTNNTEYLNDDKEVNRKHGFENAKRIIKCLHQIRASNNLADLKSVPRFRCHLLRGNFKGCFALDIKHPFRMVIKPAHDPVPLKDNNEIDVAKVTKVELIFIGDYHD
jgi:proteic killer suppression protein